jgi:hypothetical protein
VGHLQTNGFKVQKKDVFGKQFTDVKSKYGVPQRLYSCHTALIDGYVIEGHVPADLIKRMLRKAGDRWACVPGMPVGSPGMEGPKAGPYEVLTFDKQDERRCMHEDSRHPFEA